MQLILENALLSADDGLVQSGNQIWFHFQKYPWHLSNPEKNPPAGEHRRHIEARLSLGLAEPANAQMLKGTYHLGISPHIYSYYHLLTDLLPHLLDSPRFPVLVPEFMPLVFVDFLREAGFEVQILAADVFRVEKLIIPEMKTPDWNLDKIKKIRTFAENMYPQLSSHQSRSQQRIYVSRKLAVKRHLANEEEFLGLLKEHKFRKVYLEQMSVREQVELFRSASHVIAAHGAGLTNVLFAPADVKILEIRPLRTSGQFCFENLFSLGWSNNEFFVPPKSGNFFLPLDALERVLLRWQNEGCLS
ncbi:MAG: glycosyltransferase family 61 protein [Deltaproteobacteria bacterium]|nr:glycosyltransferase family 61 protein [Deltaproteobacteria bacterium]